VSRLRLSASRASDMFYGATYFE
ncbi:uncharacterized protein METZ01_LOCUS355370, partial [marine metagenome]